MCVSIAPSEGVRELLADLPQEEAAVVQECGFASLASRLASRLLKHEEEPMKKLAQVHATSKGLVAAYSTQDNAEVSNHIASVLDAAKAASGIEERLARNLVGSINLQRSQFLARYGKLGAAAAQLLEPSWTESWTESMHTIACRHEAASTCPTQPTHPNHLTHPTYPTYSLPDPPCF